MPKRRLKNTPAAVKSLQLDRALRDYAVLKQRVREVLIVGRKRMERQLMLMRYHTGLLINEHVRLNQGRAAYGSRAVLKLEKDFKIDHTELHRYAQFAKAYRIVGGRRQFEFNLPWTHYRRLMVIPSGDVRDKLTAQAEKHEWAFDEVVAKIRQAIGNDHKEKPPTRLPPVHLGPFFTYKIIRSKNIHSPSEELLLDLGFKHRLEMSLLNKQGGAPFCEGEIVTASEGSFTLTHAEGAGDDSLYAYKAGVEDVVDGDTLKIDIRLGLGSRKGETIRLNHINCAEMDTADGRAAKRFVGNALAGCEFIAVKSVRTRKEKWGRYLGDVFFNRKGKGPLIYLNQLLLDKGHAVRLRL